jgi:hypothetical protein
MIWHGPLCISKKAELDTAIVIDDVEFQCVFGEQQTLIEAITRWLAGGCGEMTCRKSV